MTQYEEDLLLIEINELSALIQHLKAENVELRSLLDEKKKEFQPLTWEQRGVPVL